MTKADYLKKCERAVRKWQKILLLDHWSIQVLYDDTSGDYNGTCDHTPDTLRATITFFKDPDRSVDETACHEVLHVLLVPTQDAENTKQFFGRVEQVVEHLTSVVRKLK